MKAAWRCVLTAAMACSFSAASQALQAVDANALAGQKIGILIEVGELESAAVLLQALDAQNQISPALAARRMGDLYYQLGQYGRAIDIYKSIPTDGASSAHDTGQIALAYVKLNDRSALKIHLESVPTPLTGRFLRRVQAYDALKNSGSALAFDKLKADARSGTQTAVGKLDLAWVFHEMGAFADAVKLLAEPMPKELNAQDQMAWRFLLASSYRQSARAELACDIYKEVAQLASADMTGHALGLSQAWQQKLACSQSRINRIPAPTPHVVPTPPAVQPPALSSHVAADSLLMNKRGTSTENDTRVSYGPSATRAQIPGLNFPEGMGVSGASGILIGDGKFVLTNRHVVEMGKLYAVRNAMGRVSNARLIKVSEVDDLALLSVDEAFPAAQSIGVLQMAAARAGSQIYSMGYPLWFLLGSQTPSITNGLVSKISGLNDEPSMFQISAKVNKGNSGGPVFDSYGRLIGVTMGKLDTEYLRKTDGVNAEGVNFIIHTERILKFLGMDSKLTPASSHAAPLQPEMIYDKMLGAVVMVAVAIK